MASDNEIKAWMRDHLMSIIGDVHDRATASDHLADRACETFGRHDNLRELADQVAEEYL